jgi:hypothetical protein
VEKNGADMAARKRVEQQLKRKSGRSRPSDVAVTVMASVSIALPLMFYLHQHVEMLRYGYEIDSLKERRQLLVEKQRGLRAERSSLSDLRLVEEKAGERGLQAPAPLDVYSVKDARRLTSASGGGPELD